MIAITSYGSVSTLGMDAEEVSRAYQQGSCTYSYTEFNNKKYPVIPVSSSVEKAMDELLTEYPKYKQLDRTVLLAILATKQALASHQNYPAQTLINIGSSRGATGVWEKHYNDFVNGLALSAKASPVTTLGNISSNVARHFKLQGMPVDHAITCGTGLQSIANSVAWLKAGMADMAIAGASEAPLTPFTIAQMDALGIYSKHTDNYPCRPLFAGDDKRNSMVLGEAAAIFCLQQINQPAQMPNGAIKAIIESIGMGNEVVVSFTAISKTGTAFKLAMEQALTRMESPSLPDRIIVHAPGTLQGDNSELHAIKQVFGNNHPQLLSNKWMLGHTLGASGTMSLDLAIHMLNTGTDLAFPYPSECQVPQSSAPRKIMINAMGFGGNAVSIIVSKGQ